MNFHSGMTRLTIVGVVVFELILAGGTYHAWTELNEAEQRLAALPIPTPFAEGGQSPKYDEITYNSLLEDIRRGAEDSSRRHYEYAVGTVETKRKELYLILGALVVVPLVAAVIFQTLFWIGRGFRKQHA